MLRTRVFEPLGMTDTAFWTARPDRLATAYQPTPDGLAVWDCPDGQWSRPPVFADGAAGLISTVDDLLAFARMLTGGGGPVLDAEAVRAMTADQLLPSQRIGQELFLGERSWGFGLAVTITGPRAGAYGWPGGLGTSWLVDPVRDLVVIVLTQRLFTTAQGPRLHTDLQDAAYAAIG